MPRQGNKTAKLIQSLLAAVTKCWLLLNARLRLKQIFLSFQKKVHTHILWQLNIPLFEICQHKIVIVSKFYPDESRIKTSLVKLEFYVANKQINIFQVKSFDRKNPF